MDGTKAGVASKPLPTKEANIQPPQLFQLANNQTRLLIETHPGQFSIEGDGYHISISGIFAESLRDQLQNIAKPVDIQRLKMLEKQHHQLHGLSQAFVSKDTLQELLIGQSLGMLFIELTDQCNERCIHCYANSSPSCHNFLSLDQIKQVLDHARKLGRPFVQFTGGDPLIHKNLLQAVEYAAQLDFQGIEIYTNGLLLSTTWLEKLKPYKPRLCFSIYSDQAKCHDMITQLPGSWKKTLQAMQNAMQAGFDIRAGVAIMPENIDSLKSMQPFLKEHLGLDPKHVRFDPVKQTGRGQFMPNIKQVLVAPSHAEKSAGARRGKLCVSANGDVYPCIFSRSNTLGNIQQHSLSDIMAELQQQKIAAGSFEYWNSCKESLSCGDCQIIAYALGDKH